MIPMTHCDGKCNNKSHPLPPPYGKLMQLVLARVRSQRRQQTSHLFVDICDVFIIGQSDWVSVFDPVTIANGYWSFM